MGLIQELEAEAIAAFNESKSIPEFRPGDTVRVGVRVVEGERTRVQNYEGVCIARSNRGINSNFTVRKMSFGEGVERVFPLYSPNVESIEVVRRGVVRRAKLYYLRGRTGKRARIAERKQTAATRQRSDLPIEVVEVERPAIDRHRAGQTEGIGAAGAQRAALDCDTAVVSVSAFQYPGATAIADEVADAGEDTGKGVDSSVAATQGQRLPGPLRFRGGELARRRERADRRQLPASELTQAVTRLQNGRVKLALSTRSFTGWKRRAGRARNER